MRRRRVALLAVLAIAFQAILFGWHHHDIHFGVNAGAGATFVKSGDHPAGPADDDDACEICAALHHHTGAAVDFAGLASQPPSGPAPADLPPVLVRLSYSTAFQSRVPPLG